MLALAFAATHPSSARAIALVGCGTFDPQTRAVFERSVRERLPSQVELDVLPMEHRHQIIDRVYAYDPLPTDALDDANFDQRAHDESWADMIRLQAAGVYPASFAEIRCPILMVHGAVDPHPGPLIRESLRHFVPELEYRELPNCGHYPWRERACRADFASLLRGWLVDRGR